MSEKWYEDIPDDAFRTETDKIYEQALAIIREGLAKGLDFDSACSSVEIGNEELRKNILDDILKVLIAEEHFSKNISLNEMAKKLKISLEHLESAKLEMLEDVKTSSVKAFYRSMKPGNA